MSSIQISQVAVLFLWIFLPTAVLGIAVTILLHYRNKVKNTHFYVPSKDEQIQKLQKELRAYKKQYNELLCKYHSLTKASEHTYRPFSKDDLNSFHYQQSRN